MNFKDYEELWPFYLSQHSKPATRFWRFVGTSFVFLFLLISLFTFNFWWLLLAPIIAYSFAWYSHFFIEGNKPATFGRFAPTSACIVLYSLVNYKRNSKNGQTII